MAEHGLRDERLAGALTELAGRTDGHPARAARLYRAAADAGGAARSAQLADALALTGDCATAARLADDLLTADDPGERAAAVRIAASIAMHDGSAAQAPTCSAGSAPSRTPSPARRRPSPRWPSGDAAAARTTAQPQTAGPPTSAARAARSLAEGLVMTLDQPYPVAVARLGQSIGADLEQSGVTPDSPAALVTLAALHGGDPVRARSVIGRAVRDSRGCGTPMRCSSPTGTGCCWAGR